MADEVKTPQTDAEIEAAVLKEVEGTEVKEVKEVKEEKEVEVKEESDPTKLEDAAKAVQLYEALKDPSQAPIIVKAMAEGLGFKIAEIETKEEKREAVKSIKDLVKEELGADYAFLADKLGTVFEKVVSTAVENNTKDIKATLAQQAKEKAEERTELAMDKAFSAYGNISDKIKDRVYSLVDEMPPGPKSDPVKYWDRLIREAALENKVTLLPKGKVDHESQDSRRERNRQDAQNRLRSEDAADEKTSKAESNANTLSDAIRLGMKKAEELLTKQ